MFRPRSPLLKAPDPDARERRVAGLLFFVTCCSVYTVNLFRWADGPVWHHPEAFGSALAFTATLMTILLAHELGHYVVARQHGFRLGLPWFLPAPILVGTFGAIIRLQERPRTRTGMLEMGAAGPLAGLAAVVVAIALLGMGAAGAAPAGDLVLAEPLLWPVLRLVFTGLPSPTVLDPVGFAAWIGCLLTAMNLLPFGQLDGGHVFGALFPRAAGVVGWAVTGALLLGGLWWPGWAIWAAMLHLLGTREGLTSRREGPPSRRARWIGLASLVAFGLCFTPIPLSWA